MNGIYIGFGLGVIFMLAVNWFAPWAYAAQSKRQADEIARLEKAHGKIHLCMKCG
jgi:peptidoglycan biosynthesis protein MviN/MurJ (putative lipid II flippase)